MESILINPGLDTIGIIIFEQMNNQELCNCRLVCKLWCEFIDSVKFYHKKILSHKLSYPKQWLQSRKEWQYLIRKLKVHGEKESVIKIKEEIKKGIKKERYLSKEDAKLINQFLKKIQKELAEANN